MTGILSENGEEAGSELDTDLSLQWLKMCMHVTRHGGVKEEKV